MSSSVALTDWLGFTVIVWSQWQWVDCGEKWIISIFVCLPACFQPMSSSVALTYRLTWLYSYSLVTVTMVWLWWKVNDQHFFVCLLVFTCILSSLLASSVALTDKLSFTVTVCCHCDHRCAVRGTWNSSSLWCTRCRWTRIIIEPIFSEGLKCAMVWLCKKVNYQHFCLCLLALQRLCIWWNFQA